MKLQSAIKEFLSCQKHLRKRSLDTYRRELAKLSFFYQGDIEDLKRSDLDKYRNLLERSHNSGGVRHNLQVIKIFINYARAEGWTDLNTSSVKTTRRPSPVKEIIDTSDLEIILNDCTRLRDEAIVMVLWETGIRVQELCDIKVSDCDDDVITIIRRKSYNRSRVYLSPHTSKLIKRLSSHSCEYLFVNRNCEQLTTRSVQRLIKNLSQMLDKNITPHSFRHSLAWRILEGGGELIDVQNALGHTDPLTTQRNYMNWYEDMRRMRIQKALNSGYTRPNALPQKRRTEPEANPSLHYLGQIS